MPTPLSDPDGLKNQQARLTEKLARLEPGTQAYDRTKLHLAGVEKELKALPRESEAPAEPSDLGGVSAVK
jgi:exonuclease VII small subunit